MSLGHNRIQVTRRGVLQSAVAAAAVVVASRVSKSALQSTVEKRPNILLLVADDQRSDSLSCAGNSVLKTPNIDSLAEKGVRFTQSFATTAICMSSRASILTGLYTRVHGVDDFAKPLDASLFKQSYPALLKQAGYRTGFVGKWGIDGGEMPRDAYDYFKGYQGQGTYFSPATGKHLTVIQIEQALEFLQGCSQQQPFCLAVSFKAPHVQDEGRTLPGIYPKYPFDRAFADLYAQDIVPPIRTVDATPMPTLLDKTLNRTREASDFLPATYQETLKSLYRLISGVDQAVGKIIDALNSLGFDQNTAILYTADHGSFYGEHGFGGKWLMHEESIRTPMILYDPRLPEKHRGKTREQMVLNIDVPATLLQLAGVASPLSMQGRSFLPLVRGAEMPAWRDEFFYENHFRNHAPGLIAASEGIRTKGWKYICYIDAEPVVEQLFDLKNDPREEKDLARDPAYASLLGTFRSRWKSWNESLDRHRPDRPWSDPVRTN